MQGTCALAGKPIPRPREIIISELERSKAQFFADGRVIQKIPSGRSGIVSEPKVSAFQKQQQALRAKLAAILR